MAYIAQRLGMRSISLTINDGEIRKTCTSTRALGVAFTGAPSRLRSSSGSTCNATAVRIEFRPGWSELQAGTLTRATDLSGSGRVTGSRKLRTFSAAPLRHRSSAGRFLGFTRGYSRPPGAQADFAGGRPSIRKEQSVREQRPKLRDKDTARRRSGSIPCSLTYQRLPPCDLPRPQTPGRD